MYKIHSYLFLLSIKYIFINLIIISILVMFINLIEISRIIEKEEGNFVDFLFLTLLKVPRILNETIPFVIIVAISFLIRNLINNNELISMRNIGFSIFDIFVPIGISVFCIGLFFLFLVNPISVLFENKFEEKINKKEQSLYSIKITNNEMWIKNKVGDDYSTFINIKNIDLKDMMANNIKILLIDKNEYKFIKASTGVFKENLFILKDIKYYDLNKKLYEKLETYELNNNFNKDNILNSIDNYKLIPFYNYISHSES